MNNTTAGKEQLQRQDCFNSTTPRKGNSSAQVPGKDDKKKKKKDKGKKDKSEKREVEESEHRFTTSDNTSYIINYKHIEEMPKQEEN